MFTKPVRITRGIPKYSQPGQRAILHTTSTSVAEIKKSSASKLFNSSRILIGITTRHLDRKWKWLQEPYEWWNVTVNRQLLTRYINIRGYHPSQPQRTNKLGTKTIRRLKLFVTVILSTGVLSVYYVIEAFKTNLMQLIPESVASAGENTPSLYVYSTFPLFEDSPWYIKYFPWITSCEAPVWHYIVQTKSHDPILREEAIKKLVSLKGLTEAEYRTIASAIDFRTAVVLAHAGATPSMINRPAPLHPDKKNMSLAEKFREILTALPPNSIHASILNASFEALKTYQLTEAEIIDFTSGFLNEFDTITRPLRNVAEESFLKLCLQALLGHARIKDQIPTMLHNGAMDLLLVISQKYKTDHDIMGIIIKILSSFTCSEDSDAAFEESGILGLIADCAANDDVRLSFPARKALRNLDRDNYRYTLPPGLYQVYPDSRTDENELELDVIFVHGLMGGAFRTWRSQDVNAIWRLKRKPEFGDGKDGLCEKPSTSTSQWQKGAEYLRDKILEAENNSNDDGVPSLTDLSFLERLEKQLKAIPKKLLNPPDKELQPKNRELRDGEMYYFPPDEEIPVEIEVLPVSPSTKCWPRDWLSIDFSNIRVICADFETFITHWNPVMPVENLGRTIHERSDELIEKLATAGIGERPIVWVCHSAGGVILKQMLGLVENSDKEELRRIASMTKGTVFCSTPHFGAPITVKLVRPTVELLELMMDSDALRNIDLTFQNLVQKYSYKVISFGELCPTLASVGISRKLVPVDSSDPGYGDAYYGLRVDHLNICKPRSRHSFVYVKIRDLISSIRLEQENATKDDLS